MQDGAALWATFIFCRLKKIPYVHSRQRAIFSSGDSWRRRFSVIIDNYVIRHASRVMCHGPFTRSQLIKIGVKNNNIIEYDVQLDQVNKYGGLSNNTLDSFASDKVVLFLGRVEESKGVFDLISACEPILIKDKKVKLIYVGDGQASPTLKKIISQKKLSNQIITVGSVPHKEVFDYLRIATLMAMPTQHALEGWGMSAVEALAMGVPVVAPNAGPFTFMIGDNINGLLYQVDDVNDLSIKIKSILDDSDLRERLSAGAIKSEEMRNTNLITFGDALRIAHDAIT